jgi:hypothetical protein
MAALERPGWLASRISADRWRGQLLEQRVGEGSHAGVFVGPGKAGLQEIHPLHTTELIGSNMSSQVGAPGGWPRTSSSDTIRPKLKQSCRGSAMN